MFVVISLAKQHLSVYTPDGLYLRSPVSSGRPGHSTPTGLFTILGKERYHYSTIYDGAPMPFMQRLTYSGVAMHEGILPGYPASHGCVRLPHDFAQWLFHTTAGNERVVIAQEDVAPVQISHPRLPLPKFMPVTGNETIASAPAQLLQNALAVAGRSESRAAAREVAVRPAEADEAGASVQLLNPFDFAKAMKARAAQQAEEAAAAIAPARQAARVRARDAQLAAFEYRKAEIALAMAKERFDYLDRALQRASGEEAVKAATAAKEAAEAKLNEAKAALQAAAQAKAQRDEQIEAAARAVRQLELNRQAAADAAKTWNRRLAPLSIFISRKSQRLYVRQNYIKVFDLPIAIREPDKPIGTHLFLAMSDGGKGAAADPSLRWLVLTIPESGAREGEDLFGRRRRAGRDAAPSAYVSQPSAAEALDRIDIPGEVAEKLAEMLWSGASLIVSDNEMSRETTDFDRTDFIVLTH